LGENSSEILASLGYAQSEITEVFAAGAAIPAEVEKLLWSKPKDPKGAKRDVRHQETNH
jgi:hypothetical protein